MKASWGKVRIGAIAIVGAAGLAILAIVVLNNPRLVEAQLAQTIPPPHPIPSLVQPGSEPVPHPTPSEEAARAFGAPGAIISGTWTPLNNQPSFGAESVFLLTDGRILTQDSNLTNGAWWTLTPDNTGSYINGQWTSVASPANLGCPNGYPGQSADTVYSPLYYASAVLADGRFVMIGGEYNYNYDYPTTFSGNKVSNETWTNQGAIYDPVQNVWTCITAPSAWTQIGDAPSVVLEDGTFMVGEAAQDQVATLNTSVNPPVFNAPFIPPGKSATDNNSNDEEGWSLMPNGVVLTLENHNPLDATETPALAYNPGSQDWEDAGTAPDPLVNGGEIGPAMLRPDGTVFYEGATGFNDIISTITGVWSPGPSFPAITDNSGSCTNTTVQLVAADAPSALLTDGNVLMAASPEKGSCASSPTEIFEFDGTSLTPVAAPPNAANHFTDSVRLLPLPTGQVLGTDGSNDVEIYTPVGTYDPAWAPAITNFPLQVIPGKTYQLTGTQFNGLSQAVGYGDDYQAATNYPLVQVTNNAGQVSYFRTHDHSTMAVATGSTPVSTKFDVPANRLQDSITMEVIANGIPSQPVNLDVSDGIWPTFLYNSSRRGRSPFDTSANPGFQKWEFSTGNLDGGFSPP